MHHHCDQYYIKQKFVQFEFIFRQHKSDQRARKQNNKRINNRYKKRISHPSEKRRICNHFHISVKRKLLRQHIRRLQQNLFRRFKGIGKHPKIRRKKHDRCQKQNHE